MLKIITAPHPILSQKAKRVLRIDNATINLIQDMKQALLSARDPVGVGLAAPQVGKSVRIFIIKQNQKSPILIFINPVIERVLDVTADGQAMLSAKNQQTKQSETTRRAKEKAGIDKNVQLEGCLSLKDIWGEVKRKPGVILSYQDEKGKPHSQKFYGFISTIIQHENDHLNGILFPKRVLEQKGTLYKSHKDEKGEDLFEEIEI